MHMNWKKAISGLLTVLLLLSVFPAAVFAEGTESADSVLNAEPSVPLTDESGDRWTVTLTSRTEASSSSVCRLSGGGTYDDGESVTVTAYPRKGYTFVGWYRADDTSFANQLSKQQSYTFTVTEDTSLVALFAVSQGTLFRLTVHGSLFVVNSGAVQSDMFTSTYNAGETMYVSYRDDTKEFLYWVNASGNILSTEKDFSFALASDTEISSYYAANDTTETTGMVIFRNAYKQVIQSRTYAVGQPISYPASNPNKMGYLFTGWYIADENGEPTETEATEEAIYAAMEGANAVVVVPGYVASGNEYTVTVAYTDTEGNALKDPVTKVMGVGNSKTFYAPTITGYNFQYWTLNGVKASYGNAYTIIYATPGEAKLCAVYAEGNVTPEPTIIITQTYSKYDESANRYIVSNTEQYFAPAEYVVMEVGFVWSKNAGLYGVAGGADKLELGAPDVKKHISNLTANEGIYTFNLRTENPENVYFEKAYMILKAPDGSLVTYYSDMTVGSFNSLNDPEARYTVAFVNDGGATLQSSEYAFGETPAYTGETPTKEADAQYTYTFAGWTPEITMVTGNATYTATYTTTTNRYTIRFVDEDGTELQSREYAYGETPVYTGETPTKEATAENTYTFAGWDPEITAVTGDATYTATYSNTVKSYTVKFVNYDGTELQSSEVAYGEIPAYNGVTPTKEANDQYTYEFAGWEPEIAAVTGEAVYTATFNEKAREFGGPVWDWTGDENGYTAAAATFTDTNDSAVSQTVDATSVTSAVTAATCTTAGAIVYTATVTFNGKEYTDTKTVIIPALGHTPGEAVVENRVEAICTKEGSYDEVVYCSVCGEELSREAKTIEKIAHTPVTDAAVAPTCTEPGLTEGSHCSVCSEVLVAQQTVAALGHAWGEPVWAWTGNDDDGYTAAAATFTCGNDASHIETVNAAVTSEEDNAFRTVYTATAAFEGTDYTDEKVVDVAAYYLVGSMNGWSTAPDAAYRFTRNEDAQGEEYTLDITLQDGDQFKVRRASGTAFDNWYPDEGENYVVDGSHAGQTRVYFRPNGDGGSDWHCGVIYIPAATQSKFTHSENFANADIYMYRVGNGNTVRLGSIFAEANPTCSGIDSNDVIITVVPNAGSNVSANPTYTKNASDWTQSTLKFTGTGPIKLSIKEDGDDTAYTIDLEIVAGYNVTDYTGLANRNSVLMNDITMNENGQYALSNATLYGNGFMFDVTAGRHGNTTNGVESSNYVVSINNAKLDNVRIVGAVYENYGIASKEDYNFACVMVNGGSCEILNSYISNCAAPIRARAGSDLLLKNTTLKGGSFCNLDIRSGVHVTADGLTTINQIGSNDFSTGEDPKEILGLGIIFYYENMTGGETLRIVGDGLTQYNTVSKDQKNNAVSTAGMAYNNMFTVNSKFIYNDGTTQWVCTGILSLSNGVDSDHIDTPDGYDWEDVSMLGYHGHLCTKLAAPAETAPTYASTAQGAIAPTFSFEYPTASGKKNYQAKTEGSAEYCYWDSTQKSVQIGFAEGGSKTFDPNILTVTKNGKTITPTVKLDDGAFQAVTNSFIINTEGTHTLTYQYVDPYNFRLDGNGNVAAYSMTYTKTVSITVTVAITSIQPATFDFNGRGYRSVVANNVTYVMPNVTATETNSIGSKSVGGKTIYYIIAPTYYSTTATGSLTPVDPDNEYSLANMYIWCPIFDSVVTITDYDEEGTATTYGSGTTNMADGKLISANESTLISVLTWSSASSPDINPMTNNGQLYYRSTNASTNARTKTTALIEYQYTDNAGNVYRYYVGYVFPNKKKGGSCVATGTMVTLADGTKKPIEEITASDKLLAWDFLEGRVVERYVSGFAYHGDDDYEITTLVLSGGTELRMIEEHGVFDYDLNQFVYITEENYQAYLGHRFPIVGTDGISELVVLEDVRFTVEHTGSYAISSDGTFNAITEGLVSVVPPVKMFNCFEMDPTCRMKYDRAQWEKDIQTYGLYDYEQFAAYITEAQFVMYGYAYFKIAVGKGILTFDDVLAMIELHKPYMFDKIYDGD